MKKTIIIIASLFFTLLFLNSNASIHTEKVVINVETNSNECEKTLLDSFNEKRGILNTNFNSKESTLTIQFDPHQIDIRTIYKWVITTHSCKKMKMFEGTPKPKCCIV